MILRVETVQTDTQQNVLAAFLNCFMIWGRILSRNFFYIARGCCIAFFLHFIHENIYPTLEFWRLLFDD